MFPNCNSRVKWGSSSRWRNNSKRLFSTTSAFDPASDFAIPGLDSDVFSASTTFQNVRSYIINDKDEQTVTACPSLKRRIRMEEATTPGLGNQTVCDVFTRYGSSSTWKEKHGSDCNCLCDWDFADDLQDGICFKDCNGCTCGRTCKRLNWYKAWAEYKLSCKRNEISLLQTSGNHGLLILSGAGVSTLVNPESIRLYI
jgi:hypothetical protein